jgi:hypothetical protein
VLSLPLAKRSDKGVGSKTLLYSKPIDVAGPSTPSQISEHESRLPGLGADKQSFPSNER